MPIEIVSALKLQLFPYTSLLLFHAEHSHVIFPNLGFSPTFEESNITSVRRDDGSVDIYIWFEFGSFASG